MDSNQDNVQEIVFANGNRARLVNVSPDANPADIITALDIALPKAVIIISGGAANLADSLKTRLTQLFSRGIARVAADANALIIDGGTQSGVMEMMGQGVADRGRRSLLLGVAPAGLVTYPGGAPADESAKKTPLDPNHSHFVLVDSQQWGGETKTMYDLAAALGQKARVVTVLVNGGAIAKQEVLRSVRQRWPVIVLEKTDRLADEIAAAWEQDPESIADKELAEIVADGDIHFLGLDGAVSDLQQLLRSHLGEARQNQTLEDTWKCFALYDQNAGKIQKQFLALRRWIMALGVVATTLPIIYTTFFADSLATSMIVAGISLGTLVKLPIIITPILVSILVAGSVKFERGLSWVLLRNSAETIKKEIYRYRTQVDIYAPKRGETRDIKLARKVKVISQRIMKTQVNQGSLERYANPLPPPGSTHEQDDGFAELNPDTYLTWRLEHQLRWYRNKALTLDRLSQRFYWSIYILGGLGTLLAAIGFEIWIAVTVAISSALTAYLELRRLESTLTAYNQVATDLANIRVWWHALPLRDRRKQSNFEKLVENTENVIASEHAGWVQEMSDALADLYSETKKADKAAEKD